MRRIIVLSVLVAVGAVSMAAAGLQGQQQDPKIVRMQTLNVRDILYVLTAAAATPSRSCATTASCWSTRSCPARASTSSTPSDRSATSR